MYGIILQATLLAAALGAAVTPLAAQAPAPAALAPAPVVAAGDRAVDGRRVPLGAITRKLFASQGGEERQMGTIVTEVLAHDAAGEPGLLIVKTVTTPRGTIHDSSLVRRRDLRPVWHHSRQPTRSMRLDFGADAVAAHVTPDDSAAADVRHATASPTFDSAVGDEVMGALPLAEGYAARLPFYIYERGGLVWYDVRVTGSETVRDAAGTPREAWTLAVAMGDRPMTFAIDKRTHAMLRETIDFGGGREMRIAP